MNTFNQNNPNAVIGSGASGSRQGLNTANLTPDGIAAELALSQIGNFEPLEWKIDTHGIESVINEKYSSDWVDYLPRTDRPNNRKSMTLTTLPGWDHTIAPSIPEAVNKLGRIPREEEFCVPTCLLYTSDAAGDYMPV
jgi:hypothetical protein